MADGPREDELLERVAMQYYIDYRPIDVGLAAEVVAAAEEHVCH